METLPDYLTKHWSESELPFEHGAVRIIEDSINAVTGERLVTIEGRLWQPLNAENNTHRSTSKNSASLRAIPPRRKDRKGTLDIVEDHPAGPAVWVSEKPGMAGGVELEGDDLEAAKALWDEHRAFTVATVEKLAEIGLHKSQANRLLGPHLWQTIVQSSTQYENFFNLRAPSRTDAADAGIAAFAGGIELAMQHSTPVPRDFDTKNLQQASGWHLPYVLPGERESLDLETVQMCSSARTCRVSRLNHDNTDPSVDRDRETYNGLADMRPMHASPFEHVAYPLPVGFNTRCNYRGWGQLRHLLEDRAGIDSTL